MPKIVSQVLRLYTGRAFDPKSSAALAAIHAQVKRLGVTEFYTGKDPQKPASFYFIIRELHSQLDWRCRNLTWRTVRRVARESLRNWLP